MSRSERKRKRGLTPVVSALDKVIDLPLDLLQLIDEFGPNCWRSLTLAFLVELTEDYLREWEATKECDLGVYNIPALAESARKSMEEVIVRWSNQFARAEWQKWVGMSRTDDELEDYMDAVGGDLQCINFWVYYPAFREIEGFYFERSRGDGFLDKNMDACRTQNSDYHWKLLTYAFALDP